ncbi:oligosaccharide flippase family protein [Wenyingzhuangia sp. IMCC45533]
MSTLKSFLKNTIVYGIAAVLPKAINVFLVGFHTKNLASPVEFNVNTEFFVWAAYFNVLLTFGMETTFFKFYNSEKDKDTVLSTSFTAIAFMCFLVLLPMLFAAETISSILGFTEVLHFRTLISILLFDTLIVIPFAYLRVNNKAFKYAYFRILNITIYALLNILFLWYLPKINRNDLLDWYPTNSNVGYIFLATLIASTLTFLMVLPMFLKFRLRINKQLLLKMLSYSWPILVAGLAYVTNENLDKLILPRFLNKSIAGAYAGTYKLGVFMSLFITAFKLGAEPFFFNIAHKNNAKETYAIILEWFTILGALISLTIVAYIDFFAAILLKKPEYLQTLDIVPIILLANLLLGIYNNLSVWYKNTAQTKFAMYFSILGGILTVLGLLIFVPTYGYIGAAWVTFGVYAVMMMCSYILGQKHYKTPYNIVKIGSLLSLITVLCFTSFYFFRANFYMNTLFILIAVTAIFMTQRKFIYQNLLKR